MIDVLNEFIRIEKNVEKMKTEMAIKEDFNLIDAFGVLDLTGKGYITPTELREALLDIGMRCSMDEIHLVFERLNLMNDGQLKYSEFSENMMPMDQHYSRLLGTKKLTFSSKPGRCPFSMETLNKYL
jgi:Ca2+-binding EF-hand superfamily protein